MSDEVPPDLDRAELEPTICAISLEREILEGYAARLDLGEPAAALRALARAVASSPDWLGVGPAVFVVRDGPAPRIGIFGYFDTSARQALESQAAAVGPACRRIRYIGYSQAESDCELLARRLVSRYGIDRLHACRFVGLPRGGLIVLAMLAYYLGLDVESLTRAKSVDGPLLVVDDCALSGASFRQYLEGCRSREIIFAHLFSHPDLRAAILSAETRVKACHAARDLKDLGPRLLGDDYPEWRRSMRARLGPERYWFGHLEFVCFAWSEPGRPIWDPRAGRFRNGWHLLPPERCLAHRHAPGDRVAPAVQVQPSGSGSLVPAKDVLFGDLEGRTLVARLDSQAAFELSEVAGSMWKALLEHQDPNGALEALAQEYEVPRPTLARDFSTFIEDLEQRGLVVQREKVSLGV